MSPRSPRSSRSSRSPRRTRSSRSPSSPRSGMSPPRAVPIGCGQYSDGSFAATAGSGVGRRIPLGGGFARPDDAARSGKELWAICRKKWRVYGALIRSGRDFRNAVAAFEAESHTEGAQASIEGKLGLASKMHVTRRVVDAELDPVDGTIVCVAPCFPRTAVCVVRVSLNAQEFSATEACNGLHGYLSSDKQLNKAAHTASLVSADAGAQGLDDLASTGQAHTFFWMMQQSIAVLWDALWKHPQILCAKD